MNIRPVNMLNGNNTYRNNAKNVGFGSYNSSITEEGLREAIKVINDRSPMLDENGITSIVTKLLATLERMKKTYTNDKVVHVDTFIDEEGKNIWAQVGISDDVRSRLLLNGAGQSSIKLVPEFIISHGTNMEKGALDHASNLRQEYGKLFI